MNSTFFAADINIGFVGKIILLNFLRINKMLLTLYKLWHILTKLQNIISFAQLNLRGISCTTTRPWSAKIADKNSLLLPASRSFMLKKALLTYRSAARAAAARARAVLAGTAVVVPVRCTMQYVLSAEHPAGFLLSPAETALFTAATVSEDNPVNF